MSDDFLSKSAFAALLRVHPSRISQFLSEGKIYGDAIFGKGRRAKIRVSVAREQLSRSLDATQRLTANAKAALGNDPPPSAPATTIVEQVQRERLVALEIANERAREERAQRIGIYTRTEDLRRELGRVAAEMQAVFEGALNEFANAIAAESNLAPRDALHLLQQTYRRVRERKAAEHSSRAESLPSTIEDITPSSAIDSAPVGAQEAAL